MSIAEPPRFAVGHSTVYLPRIVYYSPVSIASSLVPFPLSDPAVA